MVSQQSKRKNPARKTRLIVGAIVILAVAVAAAFVYFSSQTQLSSDAVDYAGIPQGRQPDGGFVIGPVEAPVTIVAFEDFLCGHCQRYKATVDRLISEYVAKGLARFEYRFMPVVSPAYSPMAAKLTECAETLRPGSFWRAHDVMFEIASARQYSDNSSRTFADTMDMSYADLLACTSDAQQMDTDIQLGTQLGVTGTPTVFIRYGDGPPQPSPMSKQPSFEQLAALIDAAS